MGIGIAVVGVVAVAVAFWEKGVASLGAEDSVEVAFAVAFVRAAVRDPLQPQEVPFHVAAVEELEEAVPAVVRVALAWARKLH